MSELPVALIAALGQTLLHFLWQGALIGLLAVLALRSLRHAQPQTRYLVACLALLACVLAPLATLIASLAGPGFIAFDTDAQDLVQRVSAGALAAGAWSGLVPPAAAIDVFMPYVVALWASGTSVLFLRMGLGLTWIHRLRRTRPSPAHTPWQGRLDALASHFALRRRVELRIVEGLASPVSAGWWRPVVLLPAALLTRMSTDLIEALMAHELAHIRRHDYLVNLLQSAVEALLFYHPVTWWLSHRIRIEREQIADQLAAEATGAPRRLALALSELAELDHAAPVLYFAQAARGGHLMARIQQLLRPARRDSRGAWVVLPMLGLAALCSAAFAYAQIDRPVPQAGQPALRATPDVREATGTRDTFALVRKGGEDVFIWGPNDDTAAIAAAQREVGGDFLWVYRNTQTYVVTDRSLFARARLAWRPAEALERQMETLSREMDALHEQEEALASRQNALWAQAGDEAHQHELAQQQALLREEVMDLQTSGREAEQQYNQLNRELDQAAERAARNVQSLVDEALTRGLARPTPKSVSA